LSLKENLDAIKQEISAEEQFLESVIKGERFFKKYKKPILSVVAVMIIGAIGYTSYSMIKESNLKASNVAYEKLLKNPNDKEALNILKNKNKELYLVFRFQQAIKKQDLKTLKELSSLKNNDLISDLSGYEVGQIENSKTLNSEYLRGFCLLEEGFDLLKDGKKEEASLKFAQINPNSGLAKIAKNLSHYQGK
jgi:hypothetical protein